MSSEQDIQQEIEEASSLAEMQEVMREIKKLSNNNYEEEGEPNPTEDDLQSEEEAEPEEEVTEEEEQQEEDREEQEEIKPKKETKLWKEKKRKYQAIAEKEAALRENAELRKKLNEALNSGVYHYGKNAYLDLERAKESKRKALEGADSDALIEADINLTKAINSISELEKWAYTPEPQSTNYSNTSSYTQPAQQAQQPYSWEQETAIANDWIEDHPYLKASSPKYNEALATKVAQFINNFDTELARSGRQDSYYSPEYFEVLDQYIHETKKEFSQAPKKISSMSHVGAVRNSYSGSNNSKAQAPLKMVLSAEEKIMCANANISEKDWLRYKLEETPENKRR